MPLTEGNCEHFGAEIPLLLCFQRPLRAEIPQGAPNIRRQCPSSKQPRPLPGTIFRNLPPHAAPPCAMKIPAGAMHLLSANCTRETACAAPETRKGPGINRQDLLRHLDFQQPQTQLSVCWPGFQLHGQSLSVWRASSTRRTSSTLRPTPRSCTASHRSTP